MTIYFEIVGPYIAALMMSLGALCIFIWAVLSGAFRGANDASMRFLHREVGDDGSDAHAERDGE